MWQIITLIGGIWDAITGEIPDWITIPSVTLSILYTLTFNQTLIIPFLLYGSIGYLFYRYGITGGGDVLLLLSVIPFAGWGIGMIFIWAILLATLFYGIYYNLRWGIFFPLLPPLLSTLLASALLQRRRDIFVKEVPVEDLRQEDVLAEIPEGWNKRVIESGDKELLISKGIKRVRVYYNLPRLGPFIFLASLFPLDPIQLLPLLTYIPPYCLLSCS